MGEVLDLNDRLQVGTAPERPDAEAKPLNEAAKRHRDDQPRVLTVQQILQASFDRLRAEKPNVCTTGMRALDAATGGIMPGFVWVLGAETSWGKSSCAIMLADENIKLGKRVLIVSSEDDEALYGDRLLARRARVGATKIRERALDPGEWTRIADVLAKAEPIPVYLDARSRAAEWVAEKTEQIIVDESIDLVIYDYLQEFRSGQRHQDRRTEVSSVAAILRGAVKATRVAGIILSQITINDARRYPDKHSIRESRDVSNAAEVVALGFTPREDIIDPRTKEVRVEKDTKCILLDKVKNGVRNTVTMRWNEEYASFESDTGDDQQPPPSQAFAPDEFNGDFDNER